MADQDDHSYLQRLSPEHYRGQAFVHWSMTIDERRTGWLVPIFYYKFRELLTHTMFRYGLCCPIYCCMPDHLHLLWIGILEGSDQRIAIRFLRTQLNLVLAKLGVQLQSQPYDRVLRLDQREGEAFESVVEYIARNPERAQLVSANGYREYKYTGCLVPGYPDLSPWEERYWPKFWRIYAKLREHGLVRGYDEGSMEDRSPS